MGQSGTFYSKLGQIREIFSSRYKDSKTGIVLANPRHLVTLVIGI